MRLLPIVTAAFLLVFATVGCSYANNPFVGTWVTTNGALEFNANLTGVAKPKSGPESPFTYVLRDPKTAIVHVTGGATYVLTIEADGRLADKADNWFYTRQ